MEHQQFKSPISYSVQNEDYETERAVLHHLKRKEDQRVLIVASSGENALSLLTDTSVASVDAVDLNPAQIFLCDLRQTACEQFSIKEQLTLFGCDPEKAGGAGADERLLLFDQLSKYLPDRSRDFWNSRRDNDISFGVHHVGRNDNVMQDVVLRLRMAGFKPLEQELDENDLRTWQQAYMDVLTPGYIREAFGMASEALAARIAGISSYLGECHFRALQRPDAAHNYFVTTVFADNFAVSAGEQGYPLYLQSEGWHALRNTGIQNRLHLHVGNVLEQMPVLAELRGGFDLISISNIADWMTEDEFGVVALLAAKCLRPQGALLARTATGRPMIVDTLRRYMRSDASFNAELCKTERGPWFRVIAAGFKE